jgi:pyrroline-5-carboxylate reductase
MTEQHIGFIGGGNMARCLIGGLIQNGWKPSSIMVSDPDQNQRRAIENLHNIATTAANEEVAKFAQVLILAVKPQNMQAVVSALAEPIQASRPLVISVAAGIREQHLQRWLGGSIPIVRVMPNTPALVGSGASGMFANPLVDEAARNLSESILRAVGVTVWLDREELMDVVTALSGSGPAYFLFVMECLEKAAIQRGLNAETARLLTLETAFGSAKMALESREIPATLRQRVTSPGGTTERALQVLQTGGLEELFDRAIDAAAARSRELAEILGED